jgi:hypothetical protein
LKEEVETADTMGNGKVINGKSNIFESYKRTANDFCTTKI